MVPIDINTASRERIRLLRGIGWVQAARIIAARPFRTPYELVTRSIISEGRFDRIAADITTGQASEDAGRRTHPAQTGAAWSREPSRQCTRRLRSAAG
jgi:hypothetical protein